MPDRIVQTFHESDAKSGESMHPYQSVWMAHWMRTSCNSASRVDSHFALHDESKEEDRATKRGPMLVQFSEPRKVTRLYVDVDPANISEYRNSWRCQQRDLVASDVPQSAKADGSETEAGGAEVTNEPLTMNLRNLRKARSERQPFPMLSFNQKIDSIFGPKKDLAVWNRDASRSQIDDNSGHGTTTVGTSRPNFLSRLLRLAPDEIEFPSKVYRSQPRCISQSPTQLVKPHRSLEKISLAVSRPFQNDFTGLTSGIELNGFKSGGIPVRSFMYGNEETDPSSSGVASKEHFVDANVTRVDPEHCNYSSYSTFLVCDKKMDNQPIGRNSETSYSRQKDGALQLHDPSTSNFYFPISVGERHKTMHSFSGTGFSPSHSSPPGVTKLEELNHGCHSLHRMPRCSVHDVETLRICTTVGSVEGLSGCPPKFSQRTHHLLITKKTDVNLSKGDQMIREPTVSTEFKGKAFQELLSLPPRFGYHGKQGEKLEPLGNCKDSEGKEDIEDIKTDSLGLKNESSAETDTMDIDVCQARNSFPGVTSSPSNKDFMVGQNSGKSQATVASPRKKIGSRKTEAELRDISQEPPDFLAAEGSMNNRDLSSSRTESLDVEHLLSHDERPEYSNSSPQNNGTLGPKPSSRWVKRLKLSSSDSPAHGTKSLNMGEPSSREKVSKLFSKITNYSRSSSEHMLSKSLGKGQMVLDKSLVLLRNRESSSMDKVKEHQDLGLSHPWIQRLCRNRAVVPQKKPAAPVDCEPQSSKAALDEFQRKQFPSIAAMALMGKATISFRPCEFRKRGSVIVWNTEGF